MLQSFVLIPLWIIETKIDLKSISKTITAVVSININQCKIVIIMKGPNPPGAWTLVALLAVSSTTSGISESGRAEPGDKEVFSSTYEMSRLLRKEVLFSQHLHAYAKELQVSKYCK